MMKSCFLFGHRDASEEIRPEIEAAVEWLYREKGVMLFYVGQYGTFDRIAGAAVKALKDRCTDIELFMVIPYHPAIRSVELPEGFEGTFYPPMENISPRYAIVRANRYMVEISDAIICYVNHPGNTRNLLEYAGSRKAGMPEYIINLAKDRKYKEN